MGATHTSTTIRATNINKAWEQATGEAREEYGHQEGYSGVLNSCYFDQDLTGRLKTMSEQALITYIYKNCPKGNAWGYCKKKPVENKNKIKSVVEANPQKGARVWKTVYKAETNHESVIATEDSQTACIKKARAYVEKNPGARVHVYIEKVLVKGNTKCATITYKGSSSEALGTYVFIGLAPC